jgi:dUTP pyrophosphatase
VRIRVRRLDPDLKLPERQHPGDAGVDLYARISARVEPGGGRARVPTGIAVAIPEGFGGFVLPRSGLALRNGVTCLNTPGLIDAGFRDEVSVLLVNHDPATAFDVQRGDRIAQLVVLRVEDVEWEEVEALDDTARNRGGWGSTGVTE